MARLVRAIHDLLWASELKAWMARMKRAMSVGRGGTHDIKFAIPKGPALQRGAFCFARVTKNDHRPQRLHH